MIVLQVWAWVRIPRKCLILMQIPLRWEACHQHRRSREKSDQGTTKFSGPKISHQPEMPITIHHFALKF